MKQKLLFSTLICLFCSIGTHAQMATDADARRAAIYLSTGDYEKCVAMVDSFKDYSLNDSRIKAYALAAEYQQLAQSEDLYKILSRTVSHAGIEAAYMFEIYLKSRDVDEYTTDEYVQEYFYDTQLAASTATILGQHMSGDSYAKKFYKMSGRFIDQFHKRVYPRRAQWADNPLLQIEILANAFSHANKLDEINRDNLVDEIWRQTDRLVATCRADGNKVPLLVARGYMEEAAAKLFVLTEEVSLKKRKPYYGAVLNFLLRLRNLTLYINGCDRFASYTDVTWEKVRDALGPGEYAIEHFEGPRLKGMYYAKWDVTSHERNYAFVFTRGSAYPERWSRGYKDLMGKTKNFNAFKEEYSDLELIYTTGTDDMAFRDFVQFEDNVYRMHTLTDLYNAPSGKPNDDVVVFADINFDSDAGTAAPSQSSGQRAVQKAIAGSDELLSIDGDDQLVDGVRSVYPNARVFSGSQATHDALISQMPKAKVLHISTHGIFDEELLAQLNAADPISGGTGDNALRACKMALAGYNDDPTANCVTADEIRHLDLSGVELVVLDACETNAGQKLAGGAYNLAEAFYMAGAQNIVANLDPIDAELAQRFTTHFYELIKEGKSYHDAFYMARSYAHVKKTIESYLQSFMSQRIILWE